MAYSSASDVALLTSNLLAGSNNFTELTTPAKEGVENWLSSGCSIIHSALQGNGYSVPVTAGAAPAIYGKVKQLEIYYGVAMAEMSRLNTRVAARERTRGQIFMKLFEDGLTSLMNDDLSLGGVPVVATAPMFIGGISKDRKSTVESDTDRVPARFYRGLLEFPGTVSADELEND